MSSDQPPSTSDSSANDGSDTRDPSASMASFSNQVIVFLGLPGLLVIVGYLIASRWRSKAAATALGERDVAGHE